MPACCDQVTAVLAQLGGELYAGRKAADLCLYGSTVLYLEFSGSSKSGLPKISTTLPAVLQPLIEGGNLAAEELAQAFPNEDKCGLRLYRAPADYLLAMKLLSMSSEQFDDPVTQALARETGTLTFDGMMALVRSYAPEKEVSPAISLFGRPMVLKGARSLADHISVYMEQTDRSPGHLKAILEAFLDRFYVGGQRSLLDDEPPKVGVPSKDSIIGAVGEHLSRKSSCAMPSWIEADWRFLPQPLFAGAGDRMHTSRLLLESPIAFRRRRIFTTRAPLCRPATRAMPSYAEAV